MKSSELYSHLQNSELGRNLNQQELDRLITYNKISTFSEGDIIIQQGKKSNGIYILINGSVTEMAKVLGEGTTTIEILGAGSVFGEVSFIEDVPCGTSIVANERINCLFIDNTFIDLISAYFVEMKFKLYYAISKQVCVRLKKMHDKIIQVISNSAMTTRSVFGEMIQSLMQPTKISYTEDSVDIQVLQQSDSFCRFTREELNELFSYAILLKASKNTTLIHKKSQDPSCYILIHGAVQSSIIHDNKVAKLSVIGPSSLFASVAMMDKNPDFTVSFVTCEHAILFKLSESDLTDLKNNNINLWYKVFDLICFSLVALEKSVNKLDIRLKIEDYNG